MNVGDEVDGFTVGVVVGESVGVRVGKVVVGIIVADVDGCRDGFVLLRPKEGRDEGSILGAELLLDNDNNNYCYYCCDYNNYSNLGCEVG